MQCPDGNSNVMWIVIMKFMSLDVFTVENHKNNFYNNDIRTLCINKYYSRVL